MLAALRPTGPFPALVSQGEQGSTKSTLCKVVKRFVDPSASPLRSPPREGRDLQVAAMNSWLPAWDNLSYLSPELSDDLCRLATGTAMASRRLYSDHDEVLIELQRPTIINGIEDLTTRPDLASRSLVIECKVPEIRKRESDFWRELEQDAPHIFAGLLVGVQQALRFQHEQPATAIRMADLAAWATAGETALGFQQGAFIEAYTERRINRRAARLSGRAGRHRLHGHPDPMGRLGIGVDGRTQPEGVGAHHPAKILAPCTSCAHTKANPTRTCTSSCWDRIRAWQGCGYPMDTSVQEPHRSVIGVTERHDRGFSDAP